MSEALTYRDWSNYHMALFGLTGAADAGMVGAWIKEFREQGVTPEDLMEVTKYLAAKDPPRFRTDHLAALQRRLREVQQEREPRPEPQPEIPDDPRGRCDLCGSTGRVVVPHWHALGKAVGYQGYPTLAVLCSCAVGQWFLGRAMNREGQPQLSLMEYEQSVPRPRWQEALAAHARRQQAQGRLESVARSHDQTFGPLLARLRDKGVAHAGL